MPLDGGPRTGSYVSVRFGNVLGSAGSVVRIFQKQIAAGGPVTVTHPDMTRYFMSISEAVLLVLQASTMGHDSEIFELDMGEPVLITELAKNMIRLAGFVPGEDIEVRITGLRPGEKLFEELRRDGENLLPTHHEKIKRLESQKPNPRLVGRWLDELRGLVENRDDETLKAHMARLVPEYRGQLAPVPVRARTGTVHQILSSEESENTAAALVLDSPPA
jgi:FlaA1/EpsC-like NDP-sugar epimerase